MRDDGGAFLGIDLGTQGVRALAVTPAGEVLAGAAQPLTSHRHGVRNEQDPEQWWNALAQACRATTARLTTGTIEALAICGTSGTIVLVDAGGTPLSPGLMYDDGRAAEDAARANAEGAHVWEELGYRIEDTWALPKLLWLLRQRPAPRDARLRHQVDFVVRRLVGHDTPTDSSNALKTGYDLKRDAWPHDVMSALGVPDGALPDVVRPGTELGVVSTEAATATGIPARTPVIAGMTDGCAAQLAGGPLTVGSWNSTLGTTLVLKGVTPEPIRDPDRAIYSHRSPDGRWLPGGASGVGAGVLTQRFPGRDLNALDQRAAKHEPANPLAYPLVSRGERFPFHAPQAERFMLGAATDEADEFAAILQGVAYVERLCFDHLDRICAPIGGELTFTGGAARSRYWCQLRADVLGRAVRLPVNADPALGMAVLAASRGHELAETASKMTRIRATLEPRAAARDRFRQRYIDLVSELEKRGWLHHDLAAHARARAGRSH